jgi:hypothetical protein
MGPISAISTLALILASSPVPTSNRELAAQAVEHAFFGRRCLPAAHPGGGPQAAYFELRLLEARLDAAVDLLNDAGEEIDLEKIRAELNDGLAGVWFVDCTLNDARSGDPAKARKSFRDDVLELERRGIAMAVGRLQPVKDYDGDGIISTQPHSY